MGDESKHLVTELDRLDGSFVEPRILDGDGCSVRQRLSEIKIVPSIPTRRARGDECNHAEQQPMPLKRHCHQRRSAHGAQRL